VIPLFAQAAGVSLAPARASEYAAKVDATFLYILAITGAVGLAVLALLVVFAVRYRRRTDADPTPRITGSPPLEWAWTLAPLVVFAAMFWWGLDAYRDNFRPPPDAAEVFVVGKQWMWKVQHPGGRREVNELHLPVGRPVRITLISEDVIHDFAVPAFRSKIDVLPGRYVGTWYRPTAVGRFHLFCDQFCGTAHARMAGSVVVMRPEEYEAWQREGADGSPALEGRKLFLKLQCLTCHTADGGGRGPVLEGLYGRRVPLRGGGSVVADHDYIRESILLPGAKVVDGHDPVMPTYRGQVTEEEVLRLIAFIRSLGKGDTLRPNNADPAPVGTPNSGAAGGEKK
jgi:cytochrome c oxidase subunit 2